MDINNYNKIIESVNNLKEMKQTYENAKNELLKIVENISDINDMMEKIEYFTPNDRLFLKTELKRKGKIFLELSYRTINLQYAIGELKKYIANLL